MRTVTRRSFLRTVVGTTAAASFICHGKTFDRAPAYIHQTGDSAALFTELAGVKVETEVIPPKELREKAVLELASGSGNYATPTGDPMCLLAVQNAFRC